MLGLKQGMVKTMLIFCEKIVIIGEVQDFAFVTESAHQRSWFFECIKRLREWFLCAKVNTFVTVF